MSVLVTVGSTAFDALIQTVTSDVFLDVLRNKGFSRLIVQRGSSTVSGEGIGSNGNFHSSRLHGIDIELWKYKPSLRAEMEKADIIISHAGSGTILEALRLRKALIVVPNSTLLDDHQQELAQALEAEGHLKSTSVSDLAKSVAAFKAEGMSCFPQFNGGKFARLLDEEMGFS
ncbi:hypothetical protein AX15_003051 [Amanita polypyramis BW_CC]|nr:hypothetical protein AX15_003051 [Amanita polypyramis BW_CC]